MKALEYGKGYTMYPESEESLLPEKIKKEKVLLKTYD
jgi:hypothetical protein